MESQTAQPLSSETTTPWPQYVPGMTRAQIHKAVLEAGVILNKIENPNLSSVLPTLKHAVLCYRSLYSLACYLFLVSADKAPANDPNKEKAARRLAGFEDKSLHRSLCQIVAEVSTIILEGGTSGEGGYGIGTKGLYRLGRRLVRPVGRMHSLAVSARVLLDTHSMSIQDQLKFSCYLLETHIKVFTAPTVPEGEQQTHAYWFKGVKGNAGADPMCLAVVDANIAQSGANFAL